ncbi:MAG: ribosome silencing factor [Gemmatimonadota bacterium]
MPIRTRSSEDVAALTDRELGTLTDAVLERKAREPVLLDLRGISDATDYFLIATGDSDTHTRAIADHVVERMKSLGVRPAGVEGRSAAGWILLDYIGVIVHIFLPRYREFYQLESLWGDAPARALE